MDKTQKAKHKREAERLLSRARKTARLRRIPKPSKNDPDVILLSDGSRYEEIMDDIADMKAFLELGGLTLADIGTDEKELSKLKGASDRLNTPHRERMARARSERSHNDYGDDEL